MLQDLETGGLVLFVQNVDSTLHKNPLSPDKFKAFIMDSVASSKRIFDFIAKLHVLIYKEETTAGNDIAHPLIIPDFVPGVQDQAVQAVEPDVNMAEIEFDEEEFETEIVRIDEVDAINAAAPETEEVIT